MGKIKLILVFFVFMGLGLILITGNLFDDKTEISKKIGFKVGEDVPSFSFISMGSSKSEKLEDFRGKIVILNFWATFCEPCIKEIPSLLQLVERMDGKIQLVAISGDSNVEDIMAFIKVFPGLKGKNVHLIWEKDQEILKRYQILRLPETFVLDKDLKFKKKVSGEVNWLSPEAIQFFNHILISK